MKAKQLPSGNYRVQVVAGYDENGKRIVKSFTAEKEWQALKKASDFLESKNNEIDLSITLRTAITKCIESKRNLIEETTLLFYHKVLRNRFQNLMDVKLEDLNILIIQQEINRESEYLSPITVRNSYEVIRSALLMYDVDINLKRIKLPKMKKNEKTLPSFETVFKAVKGTSVELPVLLACWLSLRRGEVLGLKFKDVDFESQIIHVRRTVIKTEEGEKIREGCKTERSKRILQLPTYILNLINEVPHENEDSFIIKYTGHGLYTKFKSVMRRNGIEMTFHDLRRLNASVMLMLGIPDKYAMERGGWSTNTILKSVYQKTFTSERRKVDKIIDNYFDEIIENDSTDNHTKSHE